MKRCPSCQKTYQDDAPDYCSNDGMRLVSEEAASYDPERTMMASAQRFSEPASPQDTPSATEPEPQYHAVQPGAPPPLPPPPGVQPPQQWQPQAGAQYPQQGWPAAPPPPPPAQQVQAAPAWQNPVQPSPANAPYGAPYVIEPMGRSRAFAIAGLVFGTNAVAIMVMLVTRSLNFALNSMLILSILGIGFGVLGLILSLQKPSRFGGIPLAIAGFAAGTAALVYYFVR